MDALLATIVTWLALNYGLPATYTFPTIQYLPEAEIYKARYRDTNGRYLPVIAVYNSPDRAILLPQSWTPVSPVDVSILVHEMVHHLQNEASVKYPCNEAREATAYSAQEKWLNQHGTNLQKEFGMNLLALKVLTNCGLP